MTSYAFRDARGDLVLSAPEFAKPRPAHTLTPSALEAVEAMRRLGHERRLDAVVRSLVTDHGRPHVAPYTGGVPAAAKRVEKAASAAGFETQLLTFAEGCRVEGIDRAARVGFTATFIRGRAKSATWNTPWRYGIVPDDRPVGVNSLTRTGLAGKRPAGVGATRLAILGSPWGIALTHTELAKRIAEHGQ